MRFTILNASVFNKFISRKLITVDRNNQLTININITYRIGVKLHKRCIFYNPTQYISV